MNEEKRKILIIHPSMEIGGAERALLGLLNSVNYERYDVDLLLCGHHGDFLSLIPKSVNLLPYDKRYDVFDCPVKTMIRKGQFIPAGVRLWARYIEKKTCRKYKNPHSVWHAQQLVHFYMQRLIPNVEENYDCAINFLGVPSILVHKVSGKVKMTWVHTDYNKIIADRNLDLNLYQQVDWVVNVSEDCKRIFDEHYPGLQSKSIVIENILNRHLVHHFACEFIPTEYSADTINLLSIGRFSFPKKFDDIPIIAKMMKEACKSRFMWYIIGYGTDEALIRERIIKYEVEDTVIILGKRINPYPYIKHCDIYLQPSRYEGKAVTVREAQVLGKPVVVTAYDTAPSQIVDGQDGIILPMDCMQFAKKLVELIQSPDLLDRISSYCQNHDFGNEQEIEKIYHRIS